MRSACVFLICLLVFQNPAGTAVIVVDGSCNLGDAVESANTDTSVGGCAAGSGIDEIQLTGSLELTAALPTVTSDLVVEGNDHTIDRGDAAPDFRFFTVDGASFTLRNTTLTNGSSVGDGGAIRADNATLQVHGSILSGNAAGDDGGAISIYESYGVIANSTLSSNTAGQHGGGIEATENSMLLLTDSTISGNSAHEGGGVYTGWYSQLTITGSTVAGNTAYAGAGVYAVNTVYGRLVNTTVSGNTGSTYGGGVFSSYYSLVRLLNSTVIGNGTGNLYTGFFSAGAIDITRTLVAQPESGINCDGTNSVGGMGNFSDGGCPDATMVVASVDFDPTLLDNGGPTATHALLVGSAAINASGCALDTDQRGFARDGSCDGGSFEFGALPVEVGGQADRMNTRRVRCQNLTTSQVVAFDLAGEAEWSCEAEGLIVSSGDSIRQAVIGLAAPGARGGTVGLGDAAVTCRNISSGNAATLPVPARIWDCVADGGLAISSGDRVEQVFVSDVP